MTQYVQFAVIKLSATILYDVEMILLNYQLHVAEYNPVNGFISRWEQRLNSISLSSKVTRE